MTNELVERANNWCEKETVCAVHEKGYSDSHTASDSAIFDASLLISDLLKLAKSQAAEIEKLKRVIRQYIDNASDRAVYEFNYKDGEYANTGDTFNLLVTEKAELEAKCAEYDKAMESVASDAPNWKARQIRETLERIRGKDDG
jgi:hypothetical protein